jgi:iron(III) transport system ATP-binding protein
VNAAAIRVVDVSKRFGSHLALDRVSLDVVAGEATVILGPSGCGKTTLLRVIAGLEVPDSGEVSLNGTKVSGPGRAIVPPHQRKLGFVFQDLALWPHLTVQQNLDFVLAAAGTSGNERRRRALEALALVRIEPLAARYPHQLSGGEQQRVALARAIVGQPRVLLLDEPLSSLDPQLRSALRTELTRLRRTLAVTSVYVTHDGEDAVALADRVVEMREGKIVASRANESGRKEQP